LVGVAGLLVSALVPISAVHDAVRVGAAVTPTPRLTVGDMSVAEGDSGRVGVAVPVDLDYPAPATITATYAVSGGSAVPRVDFVAPRTGNRTGILTFRAGHTDAFVRVLIIGNRTALGNKTINIDVTAGAGVNVTKGRGTVTILDDDTASAPAQLLAKSVAGTAFAAAASMPRVSLGTPTIWEGNAGLRRASVPVSLSDPASGGVTVSFNLPGTADLSLDACKSIPTADVTIKPLTKTLAFRTGQQSKQVLIPIRGNVAADQLYNVIDSVSVVAGNAVVPQSTNDIDVVDDDAAAAVSPPAPGTYRVSEPEGGADPAFPRVVSDTSLGCGGPSSSSESITADGRYVVFSSNADNLVPDDTNGTEDVFVKDTWTGEIQRVSVSATGDQANGASTAESISDDGRYVTFSSFANNLVPNDNTAWPDSFLYDRATGAIRRLGEGEAGDGSFLSYVAPDGSSVAYDLLQDQATSPCACGSIVELLDLNTNQVSVISSDASGTPFSGSEPSISADGRHVAFNSFDAATGWKVYVRDLDTDNLELISVNDAGDPGTGYGAFSIDRPAMSADGQIVAWSGEYCNMGVPQSPCDRGTSQIWVRDRTAQQTTDGSLNASGDPAYVTTDQPSISTDGRYLIFTEFGGADPSAGCARVLERDRMTGSVAFVDASLPCQHGASLDGTGRAMSADGSYVTFDALLDPNGGISATFPQTVYVTRLQ
jgi:Tol biopolymer transport system component